MNHNRILRVLNVLFLSCGYQVQWFSVNVRKFQLTLVGFIYFICLWTWYGICFEQHFGDTIFEFLKELAPILHKIIRLHLYMGLKVMLFAAFEMRHIVRVLNDLVQALPKSTAPCWSWNEVVVYIWLFSGMFLNFAVGLYVLVELEFPRPTLQQVMHAVAMFLPHFALASTFKLLNVATWIARSELKTMRTVMDEVFSTEMDHKSVSAVPGETNNVYSVEMSTIPKQHNISEVVLALTQQLEALAKATQQVSDVLQKQLVLLVSMNSLCLLGGTYLIVNYNITWHFIFVGPLGRSLLAFSYGIFLFIGWDYLCLVVANYFLEKERATFIDETVGILKRSSTIKKDIKSLLKDIKYSLEKKFNMQIFLNAPITVQTMTVVNALIGLGIALFMTYHYFKDQMLALQMRLDDSLNESDDSP